MTLLPRHKLRDDAMCTIRCRSTASFVAKLGNPCVTCFAPKQAARCRRVSPHRLHSPVGFEAQTNKPPLSLVLRPKLRNRRSGFEAQTTKPKLPVSSTCTMRIVHSVTRLPDHPATEPPTCASTHRSSGHKSPTRALILRRCPPCRIRHLHTMRQENTLHRNNSRQLG